MNAFESINSMPSRLDLLRRFKPMMKNQRGRKFTSKASVKAIEERIMEVSGRMDYRVGKGRGKIKVLW